MPDAQNNREGPQAREPSKCWNGWSYREDSDRARSPAPEAVCVPEHLAARGPASQAAAPPSRSTLPGAGLPQAKKKKSLVFMRAGSRRSCQTLCDPVACSLPGFSVREGVLQAGILEHIGQYWLPHPSRALYFPLP